MSHGPGRTMKLPRLRTKDELLKTSPEIFNKLLLGDDMSTARSSAAPAAASSGAAGAKLGRPGMHSASPPHRSASGRAGQLGSATATHDTPRGFGDEPLSENQELAVELESIKRERHQLMDSIAHVKAAAGTAGGEAQQADIRQLLKELELKKSKLNELKGDSRKAEASIARIRDDDTDAQRLTPDGCVEETTYIQCLQDEMAQVEEDLQEADAKNRLYQLLGERTRREHMAIDQKVRDKQECLRACNEDLANLTQHFNTTRAAKELAQKEAIKVKRQVEEARADWTRKIRERRAEVSELQRRQRKDHEKEVKRREKLQDKEKAERAAQARLRMEEEAYQLQVAALAPKIEAMEASWNRLRAISGAETPEQVIEYWQGLQAKEARMRELVALAERREAACKAEVIRLLASRSRMYEAGSSSSGFAVGGAQQGSAAGAAAIAAAAAAEAAAAAAEAEVAAQDAAAGCSDDEEAQATVEAATAKIAEAERRMAIAQAQFNKLRSVCVAADQGMRSLALRLSIALEAPAAMTASAAAAAAATAAAEASSHSQTATPGQQSGSRLTSAGADGMRRSGGGSSVAPGHHRAGSKDHGAEAFAAPGLNLLASKAHRVPASSAASRARGGLDRTGSAASHTGGLPLVPEDSTGSNSSKRRQHQHQQHEPSAGMLGAAQAGVSNSRPLLPSRGRNTIDDDSFFEGLPQLLSEVTDKLERLLCSGHGLDLTAITAAAAAGGLGSGTGSAASTARRHSGGGSGGLPAADAVGGNSSVAAAATDEVSEHASTEAAAAGGGGALPEAAEGDGAQEAEAAPEEAAGAAEQELGGPEAAEGSPEAEAAAAASEDKQQDEQQDKAAAAPDGAAAEAQPAAEPAAASPAPAAAARPADAAASTMSPAAGSESGGSTAAAATSPGGSSFIATQSPTFAGRANAASSILLNEKALLKGMHRRTWVGAPWLDAVSDNPLDTKLVPSMKRKKGKKGDAASGPDLSRILGYIPPNDVPAESESDGDDSADAACCGGGAVTAADAVVDREWIKMRAAKLTARHNAKAAAAAAAQGGSGR